MRSLSREFLDRLQFSQEHMKTFGALKELKGRHALYIRQTPQVLGCSPISHSVFVRTRSDWSHAGFIDGSRQFRGERCSLR